MSMTFLTAGSTPFQAPSGSRSVTRDGGNLFGLMARSMSYHTLAFRVASENLANARTPGYKARALDPLASATPQSSPFLKVTQPGHMIPRRLLEGFRVRENGGEETVSGNSVDTTQELQRANTANGQHRQMSTLVQSVVQLFDIALKR